MAATNAAVAANRRPTVELVVEGDRRLALVQGLRELWAFREVIWAFAERDVRLKYKQAALGVAWAALQPLAFMAVFSVVFSHIGGVSGRGIPYPAFALSALVPWFFVQNSVAFGTQSLLMDGPLLRKVYFPREIPVIGGVLSCSVDFVVGFALLLVVGPIVGVDLSWRLILAAPLWLMLAVLSTAISLPLAALNVYYRDFRYALPLFLQIWMFASPVAYPLAAVSEKWRRLYEFLNPAAGILDAFRQLVTRGHLDLRLLGMSGATILVMMCIGYAIFKRIEPGLADAV